mgnify:CR=1 FL=1
MTKGRSLEWIKLRWCKEPTCTGEEWALKGLSLLTLVPRLVKEQVLEIERGPVAMLSMTICTTTLRQLLQLVGLMLRSPKFRRKQPPLIRHKGRFQLGSQRKAWGQLSNSIGLVKISTKNNLHILLMSRESLQHKTQTFTSEAQQICHLK